jgi:hypothetical protein
VSEHAQDPGADPRDPQPRPGETDQDYAARVFAARSKAFGAELTARAQVPAAWEGQEWGWEPIEQPDVEKAEA